jgi:hypothetical protein
MSTPMVQLTPCCVKMVFVNGNEACPMEPLSNDNQNPDMSNADGSPSWNPRRVYRITSIPLHSYIAASANRIYVQDSDRRTSRRLIEQSSRWWTSCCLKGLSCIV